MLKAGLRLSLLAGAILGLVVGCSKPPASQADNAGRQNAPAGPGPANQPAEPARSIAREETVGVPAEGVSRIIAKRDVTVKGKPSCRIDFVYAGFEPEDLYWDGEPCTSVTAKLVDEDELRKLGRWQRLEDFEQRHVNEMPRGKVLYVEGQFTASLYPVGTTQLSYEVRVAD